MQQEAERIRTLATAPTAAAGRAVYQKSLKAEPTSARVKPTKPRATGQGAITTFFRKTGDSMPERTAPSYLREAEGNSARSASAPLKDVSNFPPNIDLSARVLTSTSTISYKPLDRPMTTKPRRIEADDTWEDTKYVLLSSSPVKADNETSECESKRLEPATDRGSTNFNSRPTTISGFRPASTCHNTSVSQVQQFSANRKTLGARRTMQGWSVKHTSMPKPRPP